MNSDPHYKAYKKVPGKREEFRIKPWELSVVWGNDKRYWNVPDSKDTRRDPHIELLQVCWLEVTGSIKLRDFAKPGKYSVSFRIGKKKDAFGWSVDMPVYVMAKIGKKGKYTVRRAHVARKDDSADFEIPEGAPLQIEIPNPDDYREDEELHFGLYEVWKGRWKGGLQIYEAIVKPVETSIQIRSS
ncbi:hypothetical protein MKW94_029938 [Papaver nudicaule]|uniref:Protein PHLOEM PROTEIN 2-LIKE A9-like n=1 Tax=Papaver nudicaule TaxID=74823 RepID=A0AA42B4Q2_PAPNU|nr:hypothetical protein [Papaver nudicaule]